MKKKIALLAITIILIATAIIIYRQTQASSTLETEYLTIDGGKYHDTDLPAAKDGPALISNLQINKTVITGGSNIINFSSSSLLKEAMVSVKGISGYINIPLQSTYDELNKLYKYSFILKLSQKLTIDFDLDMAVKSKNEEISKSYESDINVIEAGTGALQISLSWNLDDDIDLHVFQPDGTEVYFANPMSFPPDIDLNKFYFERNIWLLKKHKPNINSDFDYTSLLDRIKMKALIFTLPLSVNLKKETSIYIKEKKIAACGELDIDSNAACSIDGIRNENIYYTNPEPGTYHVKIDLYSKCSSHRNSTEGTKYAVSVKYNNQDMKLDFGKDLLSGQFPDNMGSNHNSKEGLVEICAFTIPGEKKATTKREKLDSDLSIYLDKASRILNR